MMVVLKVLTENLHQVHGFESILYPKAESESLSGRGYIPSHKGRSLKEGKSAESLSAEHNPW